MMAGILGFGFCEGRIACLFELSPRIYLFFVFVFWAFVALAVDEAWKEGPGECVLERGRSTVQQAKTTVLNCSEGGSASRAF